MRILGIDLGQRRVGVAISDPLGVFASALETIDGRDRDAVLGRIGRIVSEHNVGRIVMGMPYRTDGKDLGAQRPLGVELGGSVVYSVGSAGNMVTGEDDLDKGECGLRGQKDCVCADVESKVAGFVKFGQLLQAKLGIPVSFQDERFSTVEAHRAMSSVGADSRKRRDKVDRVAAVLILQTYLDRSRVQFAHRCSGDEEW